MKNNIVIIILIALVAVLLSYIAYDKINLNNNNNQNNNTSTTTTATTSTSTTTTRPTTITTKKPMNIDYILDEKGKTFEELGIDYENESSSISFYINLNGKIRTLKLENKLIPDDEPILERGEATFTMTLDNKKIAQFNGHFDFLYFPYNLERLNIFNDKYLALTIVNYSNGCLSGYYTTYFYDLTGKIFEISSIKNTCGDKNYDVYIKNNFIYYYTDKEDTFSKNPKTCFEDDIYLYRTTLEGQKELIQYYEKGEANC